MLNQTISPLVEQIHNTQTIPSLIIIWISVLIIFPIMAFLFKTKNTNWGRFFGVWVTSAILSGIILVILIYNPDFYNIIIGWFKKLI
jgi:ABC-type sulfate transport system permease component